MLPGFEFAVDCYIGSKVLKIPYSILFPIILLICLIGHTV